MDGNFLGHHLKIWADKCACTGEIKGGVVKPCHTAFIMTSNHSIEALWEDDLVMAAAIRRHFKVIHMTAPHMFKPPTLSTLQAQSDHIFGTTPFPVKPRPIGKPHTNPCVEAWQKKHIVSPPHPNQASDVSNGNEEENENLDG